MEEEGEREARGVQYGSEGGRQTERACKDFTISWQLFNLSEILPYFE